jgi:hypothetical protein
MENYIVTAPFIQINQGAVVGLDADQAKSRAFALRTVKDGIYEVTNPFHLKMGENFGSKDKIDKKFAHAIVEKSVFDELPVSEQIKDFNRPLLLKYVEENCDGLRLNLSKKNDELKADIVEFLTGEVIEINAEETGEQKKTPQHEEKKETKKRGRKSAPGKR